MLHHFLFVMVDSTPYTCEKNFKQYKNENQFYSCLIFLFPDFRLFSNVYTLYSILLFVIFFYFEIYPWFKFSILNLKYNIIYNLMKLKCIRLSFFLFMKTMLYIRCALLFPSKAFFRNRISYLKGNLGFKAMSS